MAESLATEKSTHEPNPRRWKILGFVGVAQLMLILDVTVVAVALPSIGSDLGQGRETLTWVVSGYTLAFGGLLLLGGRLADALGARRLVLAGLALFTVASLAAGLADTSAVLLGARVAQGLAAAMLSPAALSLVVTLFEGEERNKALGIWSSLGGSGAALGVLLGGLLTAGAGWPWVFFINVPVGIILLIALTTQLPNAPRATNRLRIDILGALLVTAATGTLTFALIRAGEKGWLTLATAGLVAVAVVLYVLFAWRQRTAAAPLMDLRLLTSKPVAAGTLLILVATALMLMAFFLGTFYLQGARDFSALTTGLLFLPVAFATMIGANAAGRVIGRTGPRTLGVGGLLLAAAGMTLPALFDGTAVMVVGIGIAAAGTGVVFVVASATALGQVAPQDAGVASGLLSTFHEFGASLGAAVVSSMAAAGIAGSNPDSFGKGFATAAAVAAVAAILAMVVTPNPRTQAVEAAPAT